MVEVELTMYLGLSDADAKGLKRARQRTRAIEDICEANGWEMMEPTISGNCLSHMEGDGWKDKKPEVRDRQTMLISSAAKHLVELCNSK